MLLIAALLCWLGLFFKYFFFFNVDHFKVFIEFAAVLLLFYVLFFGHGACGILGPQPGIEPASSALEG